MQLVMCLPTQFASGSPHGAWQLRQSVARGFEGCDVMRRSDRPRAYGAAGSMADQKAAALLPRGAPPARRRAYIHFSPPAIGEEEIREVVEVLRSPWITTGPKAKRFETEFAAYVGAPAALALSSCTAAEQPPRATEAHATLQNNPQEHSHRQRTVHVLCQSRGEAALSAVLVNRTATRPRLRLRGAGARRVLVGIGVANPKGRNEFAGSHL